MQRSILYRSPQASSSPRCNAVVHSLTPGQRKTLKCLPNATTLRRKGRLKEQDKMIELIIDLHKTHTMPEVMMKMERWIAEHSRDPRRSSLRRLVPTVGTFWTPLRLLEAFQEYDELFAISRRRYVPPNFAEVRHILNIAQIHSSAPHLRLITFDADGTLYEDGRNIEENSRMIDLIIDLITNNVHVAIVTAAGYPGQPEKFETRVHGLLKAIKQRRVPASVVSRFMIMGGECNYLLRATPEGRLAFLRDDEWKPPMMLSWSESDIRDLLDRAQRVLEETTERLRMPCTIMRKERSVGAIPQDITTYEYLEELAITAQTQLLETSPLPFCAFNGGNDVFVDIGNKSLGLEALMNYLGLRPHEAIHVGDRFTESGNDKAARDIVPIVWSANPNETLFFMSLLLDDMARARNDRYIE